MRAVRSTMRLLLALLYGMVAACSRCYYSIVNTTKMRIVTGSQLPPPRTTSPRGALRSSRAAAPSTPRPRRGRAFVLEPARSPEASSRMRTDGRVVKRWHCDRGARVQYRVAAGSGEGKEGAGEGEGGGRLEHERAPIGFFVLIFFIIFGGRFTIRSSAVYYTVS